MNCIESYEPEISLIEAIKKQLKLASHQVEIKIPKVFYRGRGCSMCGGTGYKERIGIFEILNITKEIRELIVNPDFSLDKLREIAKRQGMVTMFEDGIKKAEIGLTTIEEVFRAIRE